MTLETLWEALSDVPRRVVACSGGVDSLLLATVAHRCRPDETIVVHTVTPAVPSAATARVVARADAEGWRLELIRSSEFDDPQYVSNPTNRCYFCKSHLYQAIMDIEPPEGWRVLSGANTDDLGEYRPGLTAAAEHGVRHPYIEAGIGKDGIRAIARRLDLDFAELPASPCLASRIYTGTEVTPARVHAVEVGEELLRLLTGLAVVRCRVREDSVVVEVGDADRDAVTSAHLDLVHAAMRRVEPSLVEIVLDTEPYRPGRAFTVLS